MFLFVRIFQWLRQPAYFFQCVTRSIFFLFFVCNFFIKIFFQCFFFARFLVPPHRAQQRKYGLKTHKNEKKIEKVYFERTSKEREEKNMWKNNETQCLVTEKKNFQPRSQKKNGNGQNTERKNLVRVFRYSSLHVCSFFIFFLWKYSLFWSERNKSKNVLTRKKKRLNWCALEK